MFGLLCEDRSDLNTLQVLIRRLTRGNMPIKGKGFSGSGELYRKGPQYIALLADLGVTNFLVCQDSDGQDPRAIEERIHSRILKQCGFRETSLALVPVEEMEAWILADLPAVTNVISAWRPTKAIANPSAVSSPKEELIRLSRDERKRDRYFPPMHNEKVANFLDLELVADKCNSFATMRDFVQSS